MTAAALPTKRSVALRPRPSIEPEELIVRRRGHDDDSATHEMQTVVCGYRIGPLVGRGGMSVVFQVTHPMLTELLAMKVVVDQRLQTDIAVSTIYAHAKLMATLNHPNVVRTVDAGCLPSGEPFVVMERLDGEDLGDVISDGGPLPIMDAIAFAIQACDGLAAAHALGVVHGDVKPSNLLITREHDGRPSLKIIDFAPAVPRPSDPSDPLVTCSPGYASPEQLGTRDDVDERADVWALGIVLYELITAQRAFPVSSLAEMIKAIGHVPQSMRALRPEVPPELDIVVRRCLARDREARYTDILALRSALSSIVTLGLAAPHRASAPPAQPRLARPPLSARYDMRRVAILGALGPLSALLSMVLVQLLMAMGR